MVSPELLKELGVFLLKVILVSVVFSSWQPAIEKPGRYQMNERGWVLDTQTGEVRPINPEDLLKQPFSKQR